MAKEKNDPIELLMHQTKVALRAIGVDQTELSEIFAVERGFALPFAGMQVTLKLFNGERVWECVSRYTSIPIGGETETPVSVILFREAMNQPQMLARRIAMHIATIRIDLAIEATS